MIKTELQLDVPLVRESRYEIRKKTREYFSQRSIIPPVSYDALNAYASDLINKNGWDENYLAFVMVCCGNAIWQPVVNAVPFEKRILLLPQCLKSSLHCRGVEDELGLLCSDCGNCSMPQILNIAEKLGYVTIVSEGTTITTRLVESGQADALIGVGCMEVLQKMFASVSKYSVPGIGIPLLKAGCKDTEADIEWIIEEIYRYNNNPDFHLLNLNYLRNIATNVFNERQLSLLLGAPANTTEQLAQESLLAGGKRLRPLLTILAYEAFSKQRNENDLHRLALSIECFHKASLIHDDIEDNDDTRYGKETLHTRYGMPVAINTGDLLIGEGYRLITETSLDPILVNKCIKLIASGHRLISLGQGMELMALRNRQIPSLGETLTIFDYKAATAFNVSLLLGAIACDADKESIALLEQFSHYVGIAYQIKDDITDFADINRKFGSDKPSVLFSLLSEKLSPYDKTIVRNAYKNSEIEIILQLIKEYGVIESAEELLKKYIGYTNDCLGNLRIAGLKIALHEITGKIFNDYI